MYKFSDKIISESEKNISYYVFFAKRLLIINVLISFFISIILIAVYQNIFFLFLLISGLLFSFIAYYLMRMLFSYRILHIHYLKKISAQLEEKKEREITTMKADDARSEQNETKTE